jgi:hypothetical protein
MKKWIQKRVTTKSFSVFKLDVKEYCYTFYKCIKDYILQNHIGELATIV